MMYFPYISMITEKPTDVIHYQCIKTVGWIYYHGACTFSASYCLGRKLVPIWWCHVSNCFMRKQASILRFSEWIVSGAPLAPIAVMCGGVQAWLSGAGWLTSPGQHSGAAGCPRVEGGVLISCQGAQWNKEVTKMSFCQCDRTAEMEIFVFQVFNDLFNNLIHCKSASLLRLTTKNTSQRSTLLAHCEEKLSVTG